MGLFSWLARGPGLGLLDFDQAAPQERGKRDWEFDQLGLPAALGDSASLARYANVLNQGASNSCVAHAWEQALRIERLQNGMAEELGSRLFGYSNARAEHDAEHIDKGTYLRTYAYALKKLGNCRESLWPFNIRKINQHPSASAFRGSWAYRGMKGYYKIYDVKEARTAAVRAALVAGHPVVFGVSVNEAFLDNDGPSVIGVPTGRIVGGHAMCVVGYTEDTKTGQYIYNVINSWGTNWRSKGFVYFNEEMMQWKSMSDLWVVSLK